MVLLVLADGISDHSPDTTVLAARDSGHDFPPCARLQLTLRFCLGCLYGVLVREIVE